MVEKNLADRYFERKMQMETIGKIFEINIGCFGGADATIYKQAWSESYQDFLSYLKSKNPDNAYRLESFFEQLSNHESNQARNLFENSMPNIATSIVQAAKEKEIYVVVTNTDYINPGEEDYELAKEIGKQSGKKPKILDAKSYLELVQEGKIKPEETFIYDDFTPNELEAYCKENGYPYEFYESAEKIFRSANSLYPRILEKHTDKDFPESLKVDETKYKFVEHPLYEHSIKFHNGHNGLEVLNTKNGQKIDLEKKVLKILGGNSGEGILFYKKDYDKNNPEEASKYFNEEFLYQHRAKKVTNKNDETLVLENLVEGSRTMQPIETIKNPDGSVTTKYGKFQEYTVDLRFGYEYDPETDTLKAISTYGRFAKPGEKNNVSQGGGVVEVKVIKDEHFEDMNYEMHKMVLSLSVEDGNYFHNKFAENLTKRGFKNKGLPIPFAPLPYLVSESTFNLLYEDAHKLAKKMQKKKESEGDPSKTKFIFALDAFANPHPHAYKDTISK